MKTAFLTGFAAVVSAISAAAELQRYAGDEGTSAVRIERGALIHTKQFFVSGGGEDESFHEDVREMFDRMNGGVGENGGAVSTVAKLNVYVSDAASAGTVRKVIAETWKPGERPAVTLMVSELPDGSRVACDAVAAADSKEKSVVVGKSAAVAPAGRDLLFLSGKAASGELAEATRGTMEQLFGVLELFGSGPADVVQIKAFLQPMESVAIVEKEIAVAFPDGKVPPVIYVAWTSKSRATEIELIAAAPDVEKTGETVTYVTPPGDKASPVFSRVARVHADDLIYIGGIAASGPGTPEAQVKEIFAQLDAVANAAGSDLRHLVKATYYVSTSEASSALNAIRPTLYDPARPPAASKIAIPRIAEGGGEVLIDMIAVPAAAR